ncbi:hypothetical protein ES288_A06G117700v1 [Gossypium darwinii]|uniref:Uncharacterized protein n=1 Tax=Gossypium darwinii TaxID=34276 RepID=A0A5D2G5U3_GOSDA|nr:hypothetical protein ES288_A06G117700v1 [Gossypium darwinii]
MGKISYEHPSHVARGENHFWKSVHGNEISIYPTPSASYSWLSIDSENSSCNRFKIPTNSVLKFEFELKEFLHSPTNWLNKILGKPLYEKALFTTRVYDVVQVTSKILINREKESRGELSKEEKQIQDFFFYLFKSERERLKITCLTPEKVKIALLSFLYTTQHIFSRCFDDGISLAIVPKILNYIDISFIQIYLWERFTAYAHPTSPGSFATSSSKFAGNNYRAWFGIIKSPKETFLKIKIVLAVNSTMLPSMIENSSVGTNRDSHSMEVYSMCKVVHKLGYDQMTHRRPPLPLDVKFLDCVFEFLSTIINERLKEIISCYTCI